VAPANAPCRTFIIHPIPDSAFQLEKISGDGQSITVGQSFAPVVLRVTDALGDPLAGVPVTFEVHVNEAATTPLQVTSGEVVTTSYATPVTLSSSMTTITSDTNGLVTLPAVAAPAQPVSVMIRATTATVEADVVLTSVLANLPTTPAPRATSAARHQRVPINPRRGLQDK
jgi:hypothetical protein